MSLQLNFDQINKSLTGLSQQELKQIRLACDFLISSQKTDLPKEEDWLLDGIFFELKQRGLQRTIPPNFRIKSETSHAGYKTQSDKIRCLFEELVPEITTVEKRTLGRLLAYCLANYISDWKDVSLQALLTSIIQVPQAFDKAFPDYIKSNMVIFIVRNSHD